VVASEPSITAEARYQMNAGLIPENRVSLQ
jgi:hypothetical protein